MPKGKKYNAAELHFIKERQKLDAEIKFLKEENLRKAHTIQDLTSKNIELEEENQKLRATIDTINEYINLSEDQLKDALQRDKAIANLANTMPIFRDYLKYHM